MTYPSLLVLKASAGSGKTYSLVFHYVRLALSVPSNEAHYRHILAITFTNAAAGEMKARVIRTLHELSSRKARLELVSELCAALAIDGAELNRRADATFRHMLHNYSMLSISTIDSFNQRILRSFAFDLRLQSDFGVETDEANFRNELVDALLSEVGKDESLTRYLMDFALARLEDDSSWDIRNQLNAISQLIFKENTARYLGTLSALTREQFVDISTKLRKSIEQLEEDLALKARDVKNYLNSEGITAADFSRGTYFNYISKILGGEYEAPGKLLLTQAENGSFTSKDKLKTPGGHRVKELHDELLNRLTPFLDEEMWKQYDQRCSVVADLLSLGLLRSLNELAAQLKKEKNLIFVSDFQHILRRVIADNPAPFVYERIGERYHHILFDEFQDTSELQWHNVIPLLENSLSTNRFNLIVGDGKQAIYRWRNGNARQFTDLPQLPADHRSRQPLFSEAYGEQTLENNFRSAPVVVEFNNALFSHLAEKYPCSRATYWHHEQVPARHHQGYVQATLPDKPKDSREQWEVILAAVALDIQQALEDGYRYGDIAVLTRKSTKDSAPIANHLKQLGIPVITRDSSRLSESLTAMCIMQYLIALNQPLNKGLTVQLVRDLCDVAPGRFLPAHIHNAAQEGITWVSQLMRSMETRDELSRGGTAYDLAVQFSRTFAIKPDESTVFLFDHLRDLAVHKNYSLPEVVEWWEEKKQHLFFSGSGTEDAVVITTIHSSKGLEYPVVILPFVPQKPPGGPKLWIEPNLTGIDLPAAWVKYKKENTDLFPEFVTESENAILDDLNLLYVATTRAEDRLYLEGFEPKVKNSDEPSLLDKSLLFIKATGQHSGTHQYTFGSRSRAAHHAEITQPETIPVPEFRHSHSMLTVADAEQGMELSRALSTSARLGRVLHETLSVFTSVPDDPERTRSIRHLWPSMTDEELNVLETQVVQVMTHAECSRWFSASRRIWPERDIVDREGRIYRPDRVVEFPEHVEVVDFKTGSPRPEHIKQVSNYMKLVGELSARPVKGFVVYIPDMHIEPVPEL